MQISFNSKNKKGQERPFYFQFLFKITRKGTEATVIKKT